HALTAKKFGIQTRDITLYPIGGVARLERMPDQPAQELWVALAGPAVNVVIATALFAVQYASGTLAPLNQLTMVNGPFLERLMIVNAFLVVFNMLPAFPMDGGRVLRALLAMRMNYVQATQIAASLGQAMAFFFGFLGLWANPVLVFIAFFVWIGAAQEASMVQMKFALGGIPVAQAMLTNFRALPPHETLAHVIEYILEGSQHDFPVVDEEGRVLGVLTRGDLVVALAHRPKETSVGEVMRRDLPQLESTELLENAFARMQEEGAATLPVMRNGRLVGLLTSENVGEFLMIQSALSRRGR
ncbi:site-2 protease family protein, partial [Candidatus Sumerlaeota bacterium]|nr:site-2 protease family protein [Candidatus Sumerlaeota bacterium]